jgi:ankyrin repeat protein
MVRVGWWLSLLLAFYTAWQTYQSSKLKDKISLLSQEKSRLIRENFRKESLEVQIQNAEVINIRLRNQLDEFKMKIGESDSINSDLKRQLQAKDEVLKSDNDKQKQLQTTIDGLKKTVDSLNQRLQVLCEPPKFACRSLLEATKSGDVNSTKRLVKCSGDNSNGSCVSTDRFRITPLAYAARNGHVEVVRVLLEAGTNLERGSASGWTALHEAARQKHLEVCRLLLDWGANVDPLNDSRDTPLHLAVRHGHLSVVNLLAESGAGLGLKNVNGHTALHDAARSGNLSVVKLLVERGADVRLKNDKGQTASDVARWEEKIEVAEWLEKVLV